MNERSGALADRLRIAVMAPVRHPISPPFAGGMEAHTWHLVRGLAERGHQVTLLASGDSAAGVELEPILDEHYERSMPWSEHHGTVEFEARMHDIFARAWRRLARERYDVVHNNALHPLSIERAQHFGIPMLTALHVPPFPTLQSAVQACVSPAHRFTVTSARQKSIWWPRMSRENAAVVHNGIDLAEWPFHPEGDGSLIWAGRIAPNKGTHIAVAAARLSGMPLNIVGPIEDVAYFEQRVLPFLDDSIRYVGHVTGPVLAQSFGRSSALLFTPQWEEPFGLVAIEAMACGLPIAYLDHGAAREVVGDAGVRALGDDAPGLAIAIAKSLTISRHTARLRVEQRFSLKRMIAAYERQYRACMEGVDVEPSPTCTITATHRLRDGSNTCASTATQTTCSR